MGVRENKMTAHCESIILLLCILMEFKMPRQPHCKCITGPVAPYPRDRDTCRKGGREDSMFEALKKGLHVLRQ